VVAAPLKKNPRPLDVESTQAGQAIFFNFATSYEVVKTLHVGANGYFYRQITDDEYHLRGNVRVNGALAGRTIDGHQQGEGRQRVLGIGPGLFWEAAKTEKIFLNAYFQTLVEARPKAAQVQARWIHSF
jgi:hypothetical protein